MPKSILISLHVKSRNNRLNSIQALMITEIDSALMITASTVPEHVYEESIMKPERCSFHFPSQ